MFRPGIFGARLMRQTLLGVAAFTLGSATVVFAAGSGAMQLPVFRLADGTNPDQFAAVDAAGNVRVSVSNQPSTQQISGTVSVSNFPATQQVGGTVALPNHRVILLAENITAHPGSGVATQTVDTLDCRSLVAMIRGQFTASDIHVELIQKNPDGSGFGVVQGTRAGIMTYFTVGGTNLITPQAAVSVQSNTDDELAVAKVWLLCGH